MEKDDFVTVYKYEVGTIINGNRTTITATNSLVVAKAFYSLYVNKYSKVTSYDVVVFIFDYDKNINIDFYDNRSELS